MRTQKSSLNKYRLKNIECSVDDELIRLPPYCHCFQWYQAALTQSRANFYNKHQTNIIKNVLKTFITLFSVTR